MTLPNNDNSSAAETEKAPTIIPIATGDERSMRRIVAIRRWLDFKIAEARRTSFYGELTVTLKFEEGRCQMGEQSIKEKTK